MVRRNLSPKKKNKVVLPKRILRKADDMIGEPEWEGTLEPASNSQLTKALNYYNYADVRDEARTRKEWTSKYMSESGLFTQADVSAIDKVEDWRITNVISGISRMVNRGCLLSQEEVDKHVNRINDVLSKSLRLKERPAVVESRKVIGIVPDRNRELAGVLIAHCEEVLDKLDTSFSLYDRLRTEGVSTQVSTIVKDYYLRILNELSSRKEAQVKEAYAGVPKAEINTVVSIVTLFVTDSERFASNKRASVTRKPRKKVERSAAQLVGKVQYLKEHAELKIVSVDPATIVGSASVLLYNVKYKQLRRLVAKDETGLQVSGSTISGFHAEGSINKALRNPDKILPTVLSASPSSIKKIIEDLTTKGTEPNGRINSDTVILKVTRQR